jgi:hypothetical protein
MTQRDDFEITEPAPQPPRRTPPINWWTVVIALVILAFAAGMALATLANRSARPTGAVTPTATTVIALIGAPTETVTATVAVTNTPGGGGIITPTLTSVTPTPTPSPTTTAIPTQTCNQAVDPQLAPLADPALGCATGTAAVYWAAWEPFERGFMLWRSDNNRAYAFFQPGDWQPINERWDEQALPSRGDPPPGRQAPVRGFGYAWAVRDDLFSRLGWATAEEQGFCALIQPFEHGFLVQSSTVEFCQDTLYNHARAPGWQPLQLIVLDSGQWRKQAAAPPAATPLPNPATPTVSTLTPTPGAAAPTPTGAGEQLTLRPEGNGVFVAYRANVQLDGNLSDWPGEWIPVVAVVQGAENYSGPADLNGAFQVAYTTEGLYIAMRVEDDRYRSGPAGTDLWQGDSVEIHLDRDLVGDFSIPQANGDDYQVGLSFGPARNEVRGYRWLPTDREGAFTPAGAVIAQGEGYTAEVLLPWSLFDLTSADLTRRTFGFMVSLNDNDQAEPAQQTVLSSAPGRTTFNRPDEWGTLILGSE